MGFILTLAIVCAALVGYTLFRELQFRDIRLVTHHMSGSETSVDTGQVEGANNVSTSQSLQPPLTIHPDALGSLGGAGLIGSVVLFLWGRRMFSAVGSIAGMKEEGLSAFLRSVLLFVFSAGVFLSVMLLCIDLILIL